MNKKRKNKFETVFIADKKKNRIIKRLKVKMYLFKII